MQMVRPTACHLEAFATVLGLLEDDYVARSFRTNTGKDAMTDTMLKDAAEEHYQAKLERLSRRPSERWTTFANGRLYRPVMKIMHRLGWCYPTPTAVEPGHVWCHWCGMHGRV
jgi:hypothetical protein